MALNLGATAISTLRLGTATPSKVMLGATQVWPPESAGDLWTPWDMPTLLWLDAGVSSSLSVVNADRIISWRDVKVPATFLGQGTTAEQPRYDAAGKYIDITEGTHLWINPSPVGFSPMSQRRNIFAVVAPQPMEVNRSIFARYISINAGVADSPVVQYLWNSPVPSEFTGNVAALSSFAANAGSYLPTAGYNFSTEYIIVQSANNGNMWSAAGPASPMLEWTLGPTDMTHLRVGFMINEFNVNAAFRIKELIATDDLSVADTDKVFGYLAHKHGGAGRLPANHPYKNAPPTK